MKRVEELDWKKLDIFWVHGVVGVGKQGILAQ